MSPAERLTKLKQLKRARAIVSTLESDLRADTAPKPAKPKSSKPRPKHSSRAEREVEQVADLIISNRVAKESDEPAVFTSTSTAKML